jgi:hypothetical protein
MTIQSAKWCRRWGLETSQDIVLVVVGESSSAVDIDTTFSLGTRGENNSSTQGTKYSSSGIDLTLVQAKLHIPIQPILIPDQPNTIRARVLLTAL